MKYAPTFYENVARELEERGFLEAAASFWDSAKAASFGHNRRERYERQAERCRDEIERN